MTTEIIRQNIDISAFMGLMTKDGHLGQVHGGWCASWELKYDRDWNWLMPVVEKIESLTTRDGRGEVNYIVSIEPGYCVISVGGESTIVEYQDHEANKITVVYNAVVEFIQWYN